MTDAPEVAAALDRFRRSADGAFGLDPIKQALRALGEPQTRIPPAIHITGTNGKGSTGAFLRAMAEAAGLKAHVFTSPHLVRVNERIRIAGRLVEDASLAAGLTRVAEAAPGLSYFEALAAAAFVLFAETPADLAIIEVGAGGATDATNVLAHPIATVVTPISLDHEAMFGVSGLAAIARLKSGIFRAGSPVVVAKQSPEALSVLLEAAGALGAPLALSGREWTAELTESAFLYRGSRLPLLAPRLGLVGLHQAGNAGAACAALEAWGDPRVTSEAMTRGLGRVNWPARLQALGEGPLVRGYAGEIILDGAHNPGGAAVLAETIRAHGAAEPATFVVAMQKAKDAKGFLSALAGAAPGLIACELPDSGGQEGGAGIEAGALAEAARAVGFKAAAAPDFRSAIALAKQKASRIYICGSLYLCGAVLAANNQKID